MVCSRITTAQLNEIEPYAYLRDVLERMVDTHPMSLLEELLPWNWSSASAYGIPVSIQRTHAWPGLGPRRSVHIRFSNRRRRRPCDLPALFGLPASRVFRVLNLPSMRQTNSKMAMTSTPR